MNDILTTQRSKEITMQKRIVGLLCLLICIALPLMAQEADLRSHPGYIDLEAIEIPDTAEELVDIAMGPAFIRFARRFGADEAMDRHFSGVLSLRIKAFEGAPSDVAKLDPEIRRIEKQMETGGWENLVRVKSEDDLVNVHLKFMDDHIVGLMIIAAEPDDGEVAFVNISGDQLKMSDIGNLGIRSDGCSLLGRIFSDWDWE
jgi:hypothetical protein